MKVADRKNEKPSSVSCLILWNDNAFAKHLGNFFGEQNVIVSPDKLAQINFKEACYDAVVVLAELRWEGRGYTQFYGIEVVQKSLRVRQKLKLPVLFVSFASLKSLLLNDEGNKILERQIIGSVGHNFLRLPSAPKEWLKTLKKAPSLNDLQFADVFNNQCNVQGLIGESIHKLQGQLRRLQNTPENLATEGRELFQKSLIEIVQLLDTSVLSPEFESEILREFDRVVRKSPDRLQDFVSRYDAEMCALAAADEDFYPTSKSDIEKQSWRVLLLDDEPESLTPLRTALEERGVESIMVESVAEAEEIICADVFNEIVAVVSDYRLFETVDGVEKQQCQQGYDFLFWLALQDRLTHLIALSGLSRKFLLESFQKYNTRVDVYSKQDLNGVSAINIFADALFDRGREIYNALCSRPIVGDWDSLKPFYVAHRRSADYLEREAEINTRAERFVRQYLSLLESDETRLLQPDLEEFDKLTTDLKGKSPQDEGYAEIFRKKLIARRIALWLNSQLRFSADEVFAALSGEMSPINIQFEIENELKANVDVSDQNQLAKIESEAKRKLRRRVIFLLTTNLALPLAINSRELLVEEKNWLKAEIGLINSREPFGVEGQISYLAQIRIEQFFAALPELLSKIISDNKKLFTQTGKPVFAGLSDARQVIGSINNTAFKPLEKQLFKSLLGIISEDIRVNVGNIQKSTAFLHFLGNLEIGKNRN